MSEVEERPSTRVGAIVGALTALAGMELAVIGVLAAASYTPPVLVGVAAILVGVWTCWIAARHHESAAKVDDRWRDAQRARDIANAERVAAQADLAEARTLRALLDQQEETIRELTRLHGECKSMHRDAEARVQSLILAIQARGGSVGGPSEGKYPVSWKEKA